MVKRKKKKMAKVLFKTTVKYPKGKYTREELKIKKAIGKLYASSPYLTKKKKRLYIKKLFMK